MEVFKEFSKEWYDILEGKNAFRRMIKPGSTIFNMALRDKLVATGWNLRHVGFLVTRTKKTFKESPVNKGGWAPELMLAAAQTKMFRDEYIFNTANPCSKREKTTGKVVVGLKGKETSGSGRARKSLPRK